MNKMFANISIFLLINLEVTSTVVFPLTAIDFTLNFMKIHHSFYLLVFKRVFQFCFSMSSNFPLFWFSFIFFKDSSASSSSVLWFFILSDLNVSCAKMLKLSKESKWLQWSKLSRRALFFIGLTFFPIRGDMFI